MKDAAVPITLDRAFQCHKKGSNHALSCARKSERKGFGEETVCSSNTGPANHLNIQVVAC